MLHRMFIEIGVVLVGWQGSSSIKLLQSQLVAKKASLQQRAKRNTNSLPINAQVSVDFLKIKTSVINSFPLGVAKDHCGLIFFW